MADIRFTETNYDDQQKVKKSLKAVIDHENVIITNVDRTSENKLIITYETGKIIIEEDNDKD